MQTLLNLIVQYQQLSSGGLMQEHFHIRFINLSNIFIQRAHTSEQLWILWRTKAAKIKNK